MKQFVYQGVVYTKMPDPLPISGGQISPVREADFIRYGGKIIIIITPEESEFIEACRGFRQLCYRIRPIVGDPNWRGGIDEIRDALVDPRVVNHPDFQFLSTMLTWYDKECTFLGGKIGLGQPAWWHKCWEYEQEEQLQQEAIDLNPYVELNPYDELNPYEEITPYEE